MKAILVIATTLIAATPVACRQEQASSRSETAAGPVSTKSNHSKYALHLNEGEMLAGVNFQFTPKNGARRLSSATWSPPVGTKIPLHKHQRMEEYFFIHSGRGMLLINDERIPIDAGTSLFVPQDTWHGFEFPEQQAVIYGVSSPPGLEEIFVAWSTPGLSKEQVAAVERKHGLMWKQPK
jgi:mannose-6-phosphate isomerase-like protein (cupin superfamily)